MTSTMEHGEEREAKFLEARAVRLQNNAANAQQSRKKEELHQFWLRFREEVAAWEGRLEALKQSAQRGDQKSSSVSSPSTSLSDQRLQMRVALANLKEDLDALRRQCLSNISTSKYNWEIPEEIPLTDLRLLHTEFTKCATLLEATRNTLLPKAKFVFHRYRRAKLLQEQKAKENPNSIIAEEVPPLSNTENDKKRTVAQNEESPTNNPLQNQEHSLILVNSEGHVYCDLNYNPDIEDRENQFPQDEKRNVGAIVDEQSLVIRNVKRSKIILQNSVIELHISNVLETTIIANADMISGALHVTSCQNVRLFVQSYHQMRLHESTDFQCYIGNAASSGGTIMEDCTRIVFHIAEGKTTCSRMQVEQEIGRSLLDVKDFNWLQNNVPSPNYRVEVSVWDNEKSQNGNVTSTISHDNMKGSMDRNDDFSKPATASTIDSMQKLDQRDAAPCTQPPVSKENGDNDSDDDEL